MLTVAEAAKELGMKPETLYVWIAQRRISYCKLRRSIRIPKAEIDRIIRQSTIPAREERSR